MCSKDKNQIDIIYFCQTELLINMVLYVKEIGFELTWSH